MGRKLALIFLISLIFISTLSVIPKAEKVKAEENTYNTNDFAQAFPSDMPVVFVDPPNATADPGDTITISVRIFNLSNTVHLCDESLPSPDIWSWGESLPPYNPNGRFNYSLGNIYGLEIKFAWDSNILEYVNHTVKIPMETYPDGILHEPIIGAADDVDAIGGTYTLAQTRYGLDGAFNKPDDKATIFEMTFTVTKLGRAYLNITSSGLAVPISNPNYMDFFGEIPHWVRNGEFRTTVVAASIKNLKVEALDNNSTFNLPIISGENALISATIINDGSLTESYNFSLNLGTTLLGSWLDEILEAGEQKTFTNTITAAELLIGNYSITANISISHDGIIITDEVVEQFRVIGTPQLSILGPSTGLPGDTVRFTSLFNHTDPKGEINNYTWALYAPYETNPRMVAYGKNATFDLHPKFASGNWIVALDVKDNYGVEYDVDRSATAPYRTEHLLFLNSTIKITYISPTSGSPGAQVYISGSGASGEVVIYFGGNIISYVADSDWWTANFDVPDVPAGEYQILVEDVVSHTFDTAIFTVIPPPTLTVYPPEAPIGSKISIYGENFTPGMALLITFEDLVSFSSVFSVIYVGESGAFNTTMILPIVNSGNYTIKAMGSIYYTYEPVATVSFRVTKGLDTLFEELEALREAVNQTQCDCQCSEQNQSATNEKIDSNEGSQTNIDLDPSDADGLTLEEVLEFAESMLFESRIYVLVAVIIAIVALLLSGIVILKRS